MQEYNLGGIVFVLVTRYPMKRMEWMGHYGHKAGLTELGKMPPPTDADSLEVALKDIVKQAYEARVICELLAGGLERKGEPWTEEQAKRNVAHFADVDEPESYTALALVLYDFIKSEPALLRSTLLYSMPPIPGMGPEASSLDMPQASRPADTGSGTASPGG